MTRAACVTTAIGAPPRRWHRLVVGGMLLAASAGSLAMTCSARSSTPPPRVVELYTSEGCSSCPPADAWLSTLKGRADVIALGFHVHYWDRLGWPDRFASEAFTQRQYDLAARLGQRSVYTPQVRVDGTDWRHWPQLPAAAPATAGRRGDPPEVTLMREPDGRVHARVAPMAAPASRDRTAYRAYWAVVEHGHVSRVRAGENAGETLRHDHVVRLFRELPAFSASEGVDSRLDVPPGVTEHPRRIVFVVTSSQDGQPVQAVALDC